MEVKWFCEDIFDFCDTEFMIVYCFCEFFDLIHSQTFSVAVVFQRIDNTILNKSSNSYRNREQLLFSTEEALPRYHLTESSTPYNYLIFKIISIAALIFMFAIIFTSFDTSNTNTALFILLVLLIVGIITEYATLFYMIFFIIPIIILIKIIPVYQSLEEDEKIHVKIARFVKGYSKNSYVATGNTNST